jgi:TetR/AcrR family transcriptional regulator, regulator of cefoperazone and chloramphenicol sensitivity
MNTKERILQSACALFAKKGYAATNRDICRHADANIASISYYYRSKRDLYIQAWKEAFKHSMAAHPPDGGVDSGASAEQRLRGRIYAMVERASDENNQEFQIMQREMARPTRLLDKEIKKSLAPLHADLQSLLQELLGNSVPRKQLNFCQISIITQCMGVIGRIRHDKHLGRVSPPPMQEVINDISGYAEHIYNFSIAGIKAIRAFYTHKII